MATSVAIVLMMTVAVPLLTIGQDVEGLVKDLKDPNPGIRSRAGMLLAKKGPNATAAVRPRPLPCSQREARPGQSNHGATFRILRSRIPSPTSGSFKAAKF